MCKLGKMSVQSVLACPHFLSVHPMSSAANSLNLTQKTKTKAQRYQKMNHVLKEKL